MPPKPSPKASSQLSSTGPSSIPQRTAFVPILETPRITRAAALRSRGITLGGLFGEQPSSSSSLGDNQSSSSLAGASSNGGNATINNKSGGLASVSIPNGINCICGNNFLSTTDVLMLCANCCYWCHSKCVGLGNKPSSEVLKMKYVCPFCSGEAFKRGRNGEVVIGEGLRQRRAAAAANASGSASAATLPNCSSSTTTKVKLVEVLDKPLQANVAALVRDTLALLISEMDNNAEVTVEFVPPLIPSTMLPIYPSMELDLDSLYGQKKCQTSNYIGKGGVVELPTPFTSPVAPARTTTESSAFRGRRISLASRAANTVPIATASHAIAAATADSSVKMTSSLLGPVASEETRVNPSTQPESGDSSVVVGSDAPKTSSSISAPSQVQPCPSPSSSQQCEPLTFSIDDDMAPHENPNFPKRLIHVLGNEMIEECLQCCKSAIANATFSPSYPDYCLRELQAFPQKYLQGSFARCKKSGKIVALVLSNGMDEYGNLKGALQLLRQQGYPKAPLAKDHPLNIATPTYVPYKGGPPIGTSPVPPHLDDTHHIPSSPNVTSPSTNPTFPSTNTTSGGRELVRTPWVDECLKITDINDFVHVTLIATHEDCRGKGLAKRLMLADALRWLLRGRTRAYLNMALERKKVPLGSGSQRCKRSISNTGTLTNKSINASVSTFSKNEISTITSDESQTLIKKDTVATVEPLSAVEAEKTSGNEKNKQPVILDTSEAPIIIKRNVSHTKVTLVETDSTNLNVPSDIALSPETFYAKQSQQIVKSAKISSSSEKIESSSENNIANKCSTNNVGEEEEEEEFDIVCVAAESSRRLYTALGFADVVPSRVDPETQEVKWTQKEEESGKVMANLDLKESSRTLSRSLFGDSAPLYSGRKVLKLKK